MSVNSIGSIRPPLLRPQEGTRPRVEEERAQPTAAPQPQHPARPGATGLLVPRQEALPEVAPPGTDPELWQVLSAEERAHFARLTAMGPLTYGRARATDGAPAPEPTLARGSRLDVRA